MSDQTTRISKLHERNQRAKQRFLTEGKKDTSLNETVSVWYNGKLIDMPRWATETMNENS